MDGEDFKKFAVIGVILFLIVLVFFILKDIMTEIFIGLLFAYLFYPFYIKLNRKIKSKNLSALIIVGSVLLVILLPLLLLIPTFIEQLFESYLAIRGADFSQIAFHIFPSLTSSKEIIAEVIASSSYFSSAISNWLLELFQNTVRNIPVMILNVIIILFTFFFSLREGEYVKEYFSIIFPFQESYRKRFFMRFEQVTNSLLYGQLIVGIAQGIISGIGYFMFGIDKALLFTVLTTIIGIIPVIGPWLVWIPLDIMLFINGNTTEGIQLLVYGLFVINWIDTLLRPVVVAKKGQINEALALVGAIGGIYAFGLIGFIIGPLVLALLILLIEIYKGEKTDSIIIKEEPKPQPTAANVVKIS